VPAVKFNRMPLEEWFDAHQYQIEIDIGESAVRTLTLRELGVDLESLPLRYGHHRGHPVLRERVAKQHPGLSADDILITNGAAEALFSVAAVCLSPGDHVVVEHPNYPSNYEVPRSLGCAVELFPLRFEEQFEPNLQVLESKLRPTTRFVSLTHPNNPTGSVLSQGGLEAVLEMVSRYGGRLVYDETYRDLTYSGGAHSAASLSEDAVSIASMSKVYGLPGIRIGWIATRDRELLEALVAAREQMSICNSAIGEAIAAEVLDRRDEIVEETRRRIRDNREVVARWMALQDQLEWVEPEAGVVCFPRLRPGAVRDPESLYRDLVERWKVFVVPGRCFEQDNSFFRIGFGGDREELEAGLARLGEALREHAGS
jgi:aspartate/methionine/tyrosine aminotransferase